MIRRSHGKIVGELHRKKLIAGSPDWPPDFKAPYLHIEHPDTRFPLRFRVERFDTFLWSRSDLIALKAIIDEALGLTKDK